MPQILILSGSETAAEKLTAPLLTLPSAELTALRSGKAGRNAAAGGQYSLVVLNTPLTDEFGVDTARLLAENTTAGVLLLVKAEQAAGVSAEMESVGVAVLAKPFSREMFLSAARLGLATQTRLKRLLEENRELEVRMQETKLVGRAKCVLIQHLNMTEPQAHRYIEKQAMDMRVSRTEVARGILSAYEF